MTQKKEDVIKVENGRLIVDVALVDGSPSSSGKTIVYYSTRGNLPIDDKYSVGINLYKKRER